VAVDLHDPVHAHSHEAAARPCPRQIRIAGGDGTMDT
jgi:hypothetical protein